MKEKVYSVTEVSKPPLVFAKDTKEKKGEKRTLGVKIIPKKRQKQTEENGDSKTTKESKESKEEKVDKEKSKEEEDNGNSLLSLVDYGDEDED